MPEGWGPPRQPVPGFDPDTLAVNLQDADRFSDNVNTVASPKAIESAEQAERAAQTEFTNLGADDIVINDRVVIAGNEAAHVTVDLSFNDLRYTSEQFYPTNGGQTVIVTFSFSDDVSAKDRAAVTSAVLSSWSWTG